MGPLEVSRVWILVVGAIAAILIFQFFFRYQYVNQGTALLRIDRVTGSSCYLPCLPPTPTPRPTPKPKPTVEDISIGNSRAITMVQSRSDVPYHLNGDASGQYEWTVTREATNDGELYFPLSTPGPTHFPVRVVCLCDPKFGGWYWEVHLDTLEIFRITGNRDLEEKYDFSPPTALP